MRILHTISALGVKSGGTSSSTYELLKGLRSRNIDVDILSLAPGAGDQVIGAESFIISIPQSKDKFFLYSKKYKAFINDSNYQLFHINGLWRYTNYIAAKIARKKKKQYVISPHGMLYPHALTKSGLQKKIMMFHSMKRDLQNASCIHVTCKQEMVHVRNLGITAPVAIIPNALDIEAVRESNHVAKEKIIIGFVGRLSPIKNIESLIRAFKDIEEQYPGVYLEIVGGGDTAYESLLKEEVRKLQLKNCVFKGFLQGEALTKEMSKFSVLVLPSHSENFGMVVPEALIRGVPVIASKGSPWEELNEKKCGWWVDNDARSLAAAMKAAMDAGETKRREMGENGKRLVEENYSIKVVTEKMIALYDWLINNAAKPDFIY